jgi:hypothetical protein
MAFSDCETGYIVLKIIYAFELYGDTGLKNAVSLKIVEICEECTK